MQQQNLPPRPIPTPAGAGHPPPPAPQATPTNQWAILSLVFSILAWFALPLIGGILGIVFGKKAEAEIAEAPNQGGAEFAKVGIVLGWVNVICAGVVLLFIVAIWITVLFAAIHAGPQLLST